MDPADERLDNLREHALQAAGGLAQGEQALVAVLRDIEREKGRAADSYRAVVRSLAAALEARDGYTGGHSDEVHQLAVEVARRLGLAPAQVDEIRTVALLHDIGKIGIPDGILHKPTRLDADEWDLMRQHPVIGERILRPLPGLSAVATAVRHEHERWDGGGYPDGLAGEDIPLASRVVLACDAWHALVSDRPYRRALPHDAAMAELVGGSGTQFDPDVVSALVDCIENPAADVVDDDDGEAETSLAAALESGDGGEESRLQAELRALITVSAAVAAVHRLDDVIETAAEEARRALGAGSLSILKLELEPLQLRVLINVGELAPNEVRNPDDEVYLLDDYPRASRMVEEARPHLIDVADPAIDPIERDLLLELGKVSAAAVPIVFADRVWGEIYATRSAGEPPFTERSVRFLQTICGQVAAAIGRAEMFSRVAELAYEDYLTGLANRRALDEFLERAVADAVSTDGDLSLILCDVDDLKRINDDRGHGAGDAALVRVAEALRGTVDGRPDTMVARISGDEFCIVLEHTGAQAARSIAEAALRHLADDFEDPVTLSAGIASIGTGARRPADLMRAADAALYTAKRTGRRRVYVARSDDARQPVKPERRAELRARAAANLHRMLEDGIARLDATQGTPLERLDAVMAVVADAIDASAWLISHTARASRSIVALHGVDSREARLSGVRFDAGMEEFELDDYPATDSIQVAGGSFTVHVDDPQADVSERQLLQGLGVASVVAVAVPGEHGCWLAELYGDERTLDPRAVEPYLRLLCGEAVRGAVTAPAPATR
jgi:diguanylate cyclase (GGDEF)-like protein